jgi:hypothetical protein
MLRILGKLIAIMFTSGAVTVAFSQAADLPIVPATCPIVDLEQQTDCQIAKAIGNHQLRTLERYLALPQANPNRKTHYCGGYTYFGCAATADFRDAFEVLVREGGDPNVRRDSDSVPLSVMILNIYATQHRNVAPAINIFDTLIAGGLDPNAIGANNRDWRDMPVLVQLMRFCIIDDLAVRSIVKKLVSAGASARHRSAGGMSFLHWVTQPGETRGGTDSPCMFNMLDLLGYANVTKSSLEADQLYTDDFGATLIDYSMTFTGPSRRPPSNRMCLYLSEASMGRSHGMARYLASKDQAFAAEYQSKQGRFGTFIECSIGRRRARLL